MVCRVPARSRVDLASAGPYDRGPLSRCGLGFPMINTLAASARAASGATAVLLPAVLAILLGAILVYGVGFAGPMAIHNAAHDARHAFAFPCH
jgi:cobalt transporter subunit CbtB